MKAKSIVQKKMRASYIHINRQNSVIDKLTNDLNSPDSPLKLRSLMKSTKSKAKGKLFYSKYEWNFRRYFRRIYLNWVRRRMKKKQIRLSKRNNSILETQVQ